MKKHFLLLLLGAAAFRMASAQAEQPTTPDSTLIAFSSDTQAPMFVETLWLKPTHNKAATRRLFRDIQNRRPGSLFLLGDVVNLGSSNRQWRPMDHYLDNLREENIGVYAVLGNHEVMGRTQRGIRKFQQRFPEHVPTGYVEVRDSVAIVLLNSNFSKMSKADDEAQVAWYEKTLQALDADSSIQFIITGCHHSPYTNSKIVHSSVPVQEKFVPAFLSSTKSRLFVSGHSHGFEHYQVSGKDFLVIGGGGGLHQPLREGADALPDLATEYKPLFHYITVKRSSAGLHVQSYCISDDFSSYGPGLVINVPAVAKDVAAAPQKDNSGTQ